MTRADEAHCRGREVLPMFCMEDEQHIKDLGHRPADLVVGHGERKHHVKEVGCVLEVVSWIDECLIHRMFVRPRGDGGHFGDESGGADPRGVGVERVQRIRIVRAER